MEGGVYVQYHGSLTSSRDGHALWIEGDRGALWTNRAHVWWRKRGWPLFVPLGVPTALSPDTPRRIRAATTALLDQFEAATLGRRVPDTSGEDHVWTLSMIEAAMLSDKTGRAVQTADLLARTGLGGTMPGGGQQGAY
jgi:hypothetical protein